VSNYVTSQANYRRVIGVNPGHLDPGTPVDRLSPPVLARAITEGQTQSPSVLAAMYGVDAAELAVKISEGALYPNLGLTASAGKQWDPLFNINKETAISVIGQLTVPIYQGGSEYSAIRQSKETVGQQRLNLDVNRVIRHGPPWSRVGDNWAQPKRRSKRPPRKSMPQRLRSTAYAKRRGSGSGPRSTFSMRSRNSLMRASLW
jgi:hypothetical protein